MSRENILNKLNGIFIEVFDDDSIKLCEGTTSEEVEDWDSLGHVYLIAEIEDEFHIKFDERVTKVENVSTLIDLIIEKIG